VLAGVCPTTATSSVGGAAVARCVVSRCVPRAGTGGVEGGGSWCDADRVDDGGGDQRRFAARTSPAGGAAGGGDDGGGGHAVDTVDEDVDVGAEHLAGVVGGPDAVTAGGAPASRGGRVSVPTETHGSGAGGPAGRGDRRRGRRG
jgi:hypothetical protein